MIHNYCGPSVNSTVTLRYIIVTIESVDLTVW